MIRRRTLLASPLILSACMHTPTKPLLEGQHAFEIQVPGQPEPVRMWLHLPRGYLASTQAWPLVMFLHGSGERGTELDRVKAHGPPKLAARGADYPFILVSPQLEEGRRWDAVPLHNLLHALQALLRVDASHVSATGLSLGGFGVGHCLPGRLGSHRPGVRLW